MTRPLGHGEAPSIIELERPHSLLPVKAREAVALAVRQMEQRLGFHGLVSRWREDVLAISAPDGPAKGITGEFEVGASRVRVVLHLTPSLALMRKTIETALAQFLRRSLGS